MKNVNKRMRRSINQTHLKRNKMHTQYGGKHEKYEREIK